MTIMTCDIRELNPYESPEERMFKDIEVAEQSKLRLKVPTVSGNFQFRIDNESRPCLAAYTAPPNLLVCPRCGQGDNIDSLNDEEHICNRCKVQFSIKSIE